MMIWTPSSQWRKKDFVQNACDLSNKRSRKLILQSLTSIKKDRKVQIAQKKNSPQSWSVADGVGECEELGALNWSKIFYFAVVSKSCLYEKLHCSNPSSALSEAQHENPDCFQYFLISCHCEKALAIIKSTFLWDLRWECPCVKRNCQTFYHGWSTIAFGNQLKLLSLGDDWNHRASYQHSCASSFAPRNMVSVTLIIKLLWDLKELLWFLKQDTSIVGKYGDTSPYVLLSTWIFSEWFMLPREGTRDLLNDWDADYPPKNTIEKYTLRFWYKQISSTGSYT